MMEMFRISDVVAQLTRVRSVSLSTVLLFEENFNDIFKREMREEYEKDKYNCFTRDDTKENAAYDKRKPGLFKVEFEGDAMVALDPKLYYVFGCGTKNKFSCKGTNKNNNASLLNMNNFKKVLETHDICYVENTGMRYINHNVVWYSQYKAGITAKYDKRKIVNNVATLPLESSDYSVTKFEKTKL